jgi:hypothetical protein
MKEKKQLTLNIPLPTKQGLRHLLHWLTPNGGTLLLIAVLILTQNVWARTAQSTANAPGPSATTVNYQGRLADSGGTPLDGSYGMSFALYDAVADGSMVWGPENHTAVPVSDGLFSVGLGSQTSGGIPTNVWDGDRYLEITVGGETLSPRELIRSVPIAGMALTVPDGTITSRHIALGNGFATRYRDTDPHYRTGCNSDWVDLPYSSISIDLEVASTVLVEVSIKGYQAHTEGRVLFTINYDGTDLHSTDWHNNETPMIPQGESTTTYHYVFDMEPGTHTFKIRVANTDAVDGEWRILESRITAMAWSQ